MIKSYFLPTLRPLGILLKVFVLWTLIGALTKLPFCMAYLQLGDSYTMGDWMDVLYHGLRLDVAIAGYLSLVPGLLLIVAAWYRGRVVRWVWNVYFSIVALLASLAYVSNFCLYGYWGFPLDSTPLLYIRTSPADAIASMTVGEMILAPLAIVVIAALIWAVFNRVGRRVFNAKGISGRSKGVGGRTKWASGAKTAKPTALESTVASVVPLIVTALMIIPIRGGLSTGTNHTGSVYFSSDIRLNHAAVNPIFCFIESVTHMEDIASKYRFMDDAEADRIFDSLCNTQLRKDAVRKDYNVVMVCLEGFSRYIMDEAGYVSGVTPNLSRYSQEGIYFTRFYANTFRTDRAMVALLSGLPAQPTMSVMDNPRISTSLPSIARTLADNGYSTHFYYGGDMNYSNMSSYIMGTGFQTTTSEVDFSAKERTGKWGVPDAVLFDRAFEDIKREAADGNNEGYAAEGASPFFKVVFTGSSHEPFDVPGYKKQDNPALNAFSYTDDCLGRFVEKMKELPSWKNTLIVIVPDHLGAYPAELDNYQLWRYELPLIMVGGMIDKPQQVATVGAQTDIAATLLAMLGLSHDEFVYSKDMFDPDAPHYAFFTFPDAMGMVADSSYVVYDNTSAKVVGGNAAADSLAVSAQAILQKLYDDLSNR